MSKITHTHIDSEGNIITHTHEVTEDIYSEEADGKNENKELKSLKTEQAPDHDHDHDHDHTHAHAHAHGHYHSPEEKKRQLNRIARAIGHLQHVKGMIERDDDCAEILMQLSAVNSALHNLGKEIINEHMTHCITHAIEDGDTEAVEEFQKAIEKFL